MNIRTIVFGFILIVSTNAVSAAPLSTPASKGHAPKLDQKASLLALKQMQDVYGLLCQKFKCPPFTLLNNPSVENAMAWAGKNGYTIRYNPEFMAITRHSFGDFAVLGILAHELGHIIDINQNQQQASQADREATADVYAGCVFSLAGHPEANLRGLSKTLHSLGSTPGYPTPAQRMQLVQNGYHQCKAQRVSERLFAMGKRRM